VAAYFRNRGAFLRVFWVEIRGITFCADLTTTGDSVGVSPKEDFK